MAAGTFVQGRSACHTNAAGEHSKSFKLQRHAASIRSYSGLNPSRKAELRQEAAATCCRSALFDTAVRMAAHSSSHVVQRTDYGRRAAADSRAEGLLADPQSAPLQWMHHCWRT